VPNIIVALSREMGRVRDLLPKLEATRRHEGEMLLNFARVHMATNSLEGMKESLSDLQAFVGPRK